MESFPFGKIWISDSEEVGMKRLVQSGVILLVYGMLWACSIPTSTQSIDMIHPEKWWETF